LASLELEYKIQKGIAEAALGFANDEIANKSVRRKHRMMYQQSQQRLAELETRISIYNNQKIKQTVRPDVNTGDIYYLTNYFFIVCVMYFSTFLFAKTYFKLVF